MTFQNACKLTSGDYCYVPSRKEACKILAVQQDHEEQRVWIKVRISMYATTTLTHRDVEPDGNQ